MSLRERAGLILGLIGAIGLVAYPLAYRLSTEQTSATAGDAVTTARPSPSTPGPRSASPSVSPSPTRAAVTPRPLPLEPTWRADATAHRGANGQTFTDDCEADGTFGPIWGSGLYTDDSSVCTAGVHQGVITREEGGTVTIIIRPGQAAYPSSTQNGVATEPWDRWDGSYEIVEPPDAGSRNGARRVVMLARGPCRLCGIIGTAWRDR